MHRGPQNEPHFPEVGGYAASAAFHNSQGLLDKTCSRLFSPRDLWKSLGLSDINLSPPDPTDDLPLTFGYRREKTSFFP